MNYTKGKWERHNAANGEHIWCGDEHIADLDGDNANANAKLVVSAPDLYEVCKAIVAERTRCLNVPGPVTVREIYDLDKMDRIARRALAKAECE